MATIDIIVEGYARSIGDTWYASPSTVLIREKSQTILVDPGANRELLQNGMTEKGIETSQIDLIFLTHYHLDHIINIRLFPNCKICDGGTMIDNDEITECSSQILGPDVEIISTPGHAWEHWSLLVNTDEGKVAIAGDVIWWHEGEEQTTDIESIMNRKDPFTIDDKQLRESRQKLLQRADFIIPGHGKMFKVM